MVDGQYNQVILFNYSTLKGREMERNGEAERKKEKNEIKRWGTQLEKEKNIHS